MRINHLIIGASNVAESVNFYCELFNFKSSGKFIDTGTGNEGEILNLVENKQLLQLLIVQFKSERLPNPQHIAFEVEKESFINIYKKALTKNILVRKNSKMDDSVIGMGALNTIVGEFKIFYMADPSKVNIEIMCAN